MCVYSGKEVRKLLTIVKRKGHVEKFDEKKVYGSVYASCASADYDEAECEKLSEKITFKICLSWLGRNSYSFSLWSIYGLGELLSSN